MKHQWKMEGDSIDIFAADTGNYCNGPLCMRCGQGFCHHCEPGIYEDECPSGQLSFFEEDN